MTHQQEPQVKPRYGFNEWHADFKAQETLKQIEDIKQGFVKREHKIMLLEAELYKRIQNDDSINDVVMAIEVLQANKLQDEELYREQDNSITAQLNRVIAFAIAVGLATTVASFLSLPFCSGSQSKFCVGARIIPNLIADNFREPVRKPSRMVPAPLKTLD